MKRPFVYFTASLLLGIVFSYYLEVSTLFILILLTLSLLYSVFRIKVNTSLKFSLLLSFFLMGILLTNFKAGSSQLLGYKDTLVEVTAIVKDVKSITEEESRYIVMATNISHNGIDKDVSEKVQMKVLGERRLSLGDEVLFRAKLKEPISNTNPRLYNPKLNLLTESIHVTATIKDYSIVHVVKGKLNPIDKVKVKFIEKTEKAFDEYLTDRNSSLMKSVILGKSSYLDQSDIERFRQLGLAHILAVSGLHVGLISGILVGLFAYMGIGRRINISTTIILIWLYAYIIGNPPSVIRANIMFTLLLISRIEGEAYDPINTLFFAAFIMLIINPFWAFNIGFQLSFIATFSILYLTPKFRWIFYPSNSQWIKSLTAILAVQIGLLPVQAYYFNRISIIGIIANLLIVPLFSICLILGFFLLPSSYLIRPIAYSIGVIINYLLNIQFYTMDIFSHLPYIVLKVPSPSIMGILCYYLVLFIAIGTIKVENLNKGLHKTIIFYLLLVISINSIHIYLDQSIDIKFIDVGQGDSILISTQNGDYLIDTGGNLYGSFDIGQNILLPYLEKEGIFRLNGVFITHYDADHCKSLPLLLDNMKIDKIYIGYERWDNKLYEEINNKAKGKGVPIILLKRGDKLKLDKNTHVVVKGPHKEILKSPRISDNDLSLVLLMNYCDKSILFTGDIEAKGEGSLVDNIDSKAYFLKVPHHGSKTSSSIEFLDKVDPHIAFISVGRNNGFGHPHEEVIKGYRNRYIQIFRTDESGLITLNLNGGKYQIYPFLRDKLSIIYIVKDFNLWICSIILYFIISYILIKSYTILEKEMETVEL